MIVQGHTQRTIEILKFFNNSIKSAEITEINLDLIQQFGNILSVLASGHEINIDACHQAYGVKIANLYRYIHRYIAIIYL